MAGTALLDPPTEFTAPPFRRAEGVELVGPYQGSGYLEPRYVIARPDGQVVQVSELLYRIAEAIDGRAGTGELARRVAGETGQEVVAGDVDALVRERLVPAGLVETGFGDPDPGEVAEPEQRPDHLLMLRFRLPVVPASTTWVIAGLFRWMHRPVVVVPVLVAFLALDAAVLLGGGLTAAVAGAGDVVANPSLVLAVLAIFLATGAFHEFGHVSACRYGGARPGAMGVGIYLVWPAFYSTVTDSYRLSRAGRLRTDLGGVYFNAVVLGGIAATWLLTGTDWLLLVLALLHVETVRQFLPMIRLDGYYILSDIVGVPDLFTYLGPVLRGWLPGAAPDPKLTRLRPAVRRIVRLWVALVVPFLVLFFGWFLVVAPSVLPEVLAGARGYLADAAAGVRAGDTTEAVLGAVRATLLVLPVLGVLLLLGLVARTVSRPLARRLAETRARTDRGLPALAGVLVPVALLAALAVAGAGALPVPAPSADPAGLGERLVQALVTLLGGPGAEPVAGVLLGIATAVALWPLCRRIALPVPVAGLAVALAGAVPPLLVVHAAADPAAPAALCLVLAALLAGRGPSANRGAYLACVLAAVISPVALVAVAAFVAHAVRTGQLGPRLRPPGRRAVGVAATTVAATGGGFLIGLGGAGPAATAGWAAAAATGAVVALATLRYRRPFAPVATGALVLLALSVFPGTTTPALLLLGPVLAMLGAGLADRALPRDRPARAGGVAAVVVLVLLAGSGPLVTAAAERAGPTGGAAPSAGASPAPG
ncbi:hypothetical protein WIS52_14610 [Pseudonocardia nematodicida]|uniref:Peptide zinc metalloprotease protein n=1 Tax=Pseudonocardia nematodicida TaxID=1206997 RepID=A0ABV1KB48_9PSEU